MSGVLSPLANILMALAGYLLGSAFGRFLLASILTAACATVSVFWTPI